MSGSGMPPVYRRSAIVCSVISSGVRLPAFTAARLRFLAVPCAPELHHDHGLLVLSDGSEHGVSFYNALSDELIKQNGHFFHTVIMLVEEKRFKEEEYVYTRWQKGLSSSPSPISP